MDRPSHPFAKVRVERVIASVRVVFAASTLFAVWVDPPPDPLYAYHIGFLTYAVVIGLVMWRRDSGGRLPLASHLLDIGSATALQFLADGPASPFFRYLGFALFAAALRWGWLATVRTATVLMAGYLTMGIVLSNTMSPAAFALDQFITRSVYLLVLTVVLVFLSRHETQAREELRQLARWPRITAGEWDAVVPLVLEHAAGIVGADRAVVVWSADDEPWLYMSVKPFDGSVSKHSPARFEPLVPPALEDCAFVSPDHPSASSVCIAAKGGSPFRWTGQPAHPALSPWLEGEGLISAPFRTEHVSGRVFFSSPAATSADMLPLAEVVGREVGVSLDHLHAYERSKRLAIAEDRIRVARDLHDGILQAMTGVRLELQSLASVKPGARAAHVSSDRLVAIERALALEQRDLRRFIDALKPTASEPVGGSLADRLDGLRRRVALEWRAPIAVRVSPADLTVPSSLDHALPLIVHEAVVNALKHGQPSRVAVDVQAADHSVRVIVTDDGRGFSFSGRFEHAALVAANMGPVSLRERVASLGGELAIESSPSGSRVELTLPLQPVHA